MTTSSLLSGAAESADGAVELRGPLASRLLEKSPAMKRLLVYLWEHRAEELNEYAIATEALDRRSDFDPRTDAAVRVQVARLRQKLKEFYDDEGTQDPWRLSIPLGSYQLQAEPVAKEGVAPDLSVREIPASIRSAVVPEAVAAKPSASRYLWFCVAALGTLAIGWLLGSRWERRSQLAAVGSSSVAVSPFWANLLKGGRPTQIVFPNPVFFTWVDKNGDTLVVRDPAVNSYHDLERSPSLSGLEAQRGKPILAQDYTVASDTRAVFRLAQYLQPLGTKISPSSSTELSPESADSANLILLGTVGTLAPYQAYLDKLHFRIPEHKQFIEDATPGLKAPVHFETVRESPTRIVAPGIVALLPGHSSDSFVLVLAGYHTNALISYLTSVNGLADLQKARATHGNPEFFDAVVLSEVNGTTPLRSWVAALKPLAKETR
ncbi:helix-turn-helix domain-containing protein [Terriglobus sp. 2YAB30_2]|uniref:helix-turn-helix domain-containing protein n=1 Tax=unclassified Terriglobus TaxID=2628988 RepID=UPI003F964BA0